jgi:hypothetical protein
MAQARTPDWVRGKPQYIQAKEAREAAELDGQRAVEVTDEASCARAAEILVRVKGAAKAIDKNRVATGAPYRASTKAIDAQFKELKSPVDAIVERLTEEINNFEAKKRQEEEEAQRKYQAELAAAERKREEEEVKRQADADAAAAEAAKRDEPPPPPPPPPPLPAPVPPPPPPVRTGSVRHTSGGSVSGRIEWKHEVTDPAAVPDKYKPIDEVQIGKDVRAGAREIPGVRIYSVNNLQARTN